MLRSLTSLNMQYVLHHMIETKIELTQTLRYLPHSSIEKFKQNPSHLYLQASNPLLEPSICALQSTNLAFSLSLSKKFVF
ncbi:hypothetical protein L1887_36670 [Cichorium endivia]|nr:hypothetical protein L1887_36670 [Cichorium endivia]